MTYWMKVTNDELRLPIAVATSAAELARMLGVKEGSIRRAINQSEKNHTQSQYLRFKCDDSEEGEENDR